MRPTGSGESALLLLDVVDQLAGAGVTYAVVGALAASVHGAVRASMDADVVLSIAMPKAAHLELAFKAAGFRTELTHGDADDPVPGLLRLSDSYGNRVDVLIGLRGMEAQAFSRLVEVPFQGKTLKFIGRAGGPIDLIDAARAIAAADDSLDVQLLRRLARGYGSAASEALNGLLSKRLQ